MTLKPSLPVLFLTAAAIAGFYHVPAITGENTAMAEEQKSPRKNLDTSHLTKQQKYVTLHDGTERPFENEYWDNKEPGIYVDVITGEALFSSTDKFDSGTGWPSFTKPIKEHSVTKHEDNKMLMTRTEVRSSDSDAHLGHVFDDGPVAAGGKRYCINSASLKFVPVGDMAREGYGEYLFLFVGKDK